MVTRAWAVLLALALLASVGCGPSAGPFQLGVVDTRSFPVNADLVFYDRDGTVRSTQHVVLQPGQSFEEIVSPPPSRILVFVSVGGYLSSILQLTYGSDYQLDGVTLLL